MSIPSSEWPSASATKVISYPLPFCWEIGSTKVEISEEEISLQLRVAYERALRIEKFIAEATDAIVKANEERGRAHCSPNEAFWTSLIGALFLEPLTEFEGLGVRRMDKVDPTIGKHHIVVRYRHKNDEKSPFNVIFRVIHICTSKEDIKEHIKSSMQTFAKWAAAQESFESCFILISCTSRVALARVWKDIGGIKAMYGGKLGQLEIVVLLSRSFVIQLCGMMQWLEQNKVYPTTFTERKHRKSKKKRQMPSLLNSGVNESALLASAREMSVQAAAYRARMDVIKRREQQEDYRGESSNPDGESLNEEGGSLNEEGEFSDEEGM